jgi:hypothetical protein
MKNYDGKQAQEKMVDIVRCEGNAVMWYLYAPLTTTKIKRLTVPIVCKDVEELELPHAGGIIKWWKDFGKQLTNFWNIKYPPTIWSSHASTTDLQKHMA